MNMKNVLGLINLHENEDFMRELTRHRSLAGVPFAGRYRLIDFVLSNMVNSGIQNVGILVPNKYRSLMDHLRSGKEWDLARKRDGLFILPPTHAHYAMGICKGDLEHFHNHLDYIKRSSQQYVLIAGSQMVCNMNFRQAFQFHLDQGADITVLYKPNASCSADFPRPTAVRCQGDQVVDMEVNPGSALAGGDISMEMYIMSKNRLIKLVEGCISRGETDFVKDGIIKNIGRLNIQGYGHNQFVAKINSIQSYYRHSMDLLRPEVWRELFVKSGPIYTKVKDEAPANYRKEAQVTNSLVANGCIIEGQVENSIIFRGVRIHKGVHIRNSIIMQKCEIRDKSVLESVICDKEVHITEGRSLKGERNYLLVIEKGMVI